MCFLFPDGLYSSNACQSDSAINFQRVTCRRPGGVCSIQQMVPCQPCISTLPSSIKFPASFLTKWSTWTKHDFFG